MLPLRIVEGYETIKDQHPWRTKARINRLQYRFEDGLKFVASYAPKEDLH